MKYSKISFLLIGLISFASSCDFLDIVPDETPTLDHSFTDKIAAESYLATCYAGLPNENSLDGAAFLGSDEFWAGHYHIAEGRAGQDPFRILLGEQNPNKVLNSTYSTMWNTIHKTYIFQNNIDKVVNLKRTTKVEFIAESKCIAAYCYYVLLRNYGPVAIIDKAYALDAPSDEIRLPRATFDDCVDYVVSLLDSAIVSLPLITVEPSEDLGRFTAPIAITLKAKLLTMAASPMYNGNPYYADWANKDGTKLFSPKDEKKWLRAKIACEEAIEVCHSVNIALYEYPDSESIIEERRMEHTIRELITSYTWNKELIWGDVRAGTSSIEHNSVPKWVPTTGLGSLFPSLSVPLKVVKGFYTSKGIPIEEDADWDGVNLFELLTPGSKFEGYVDAAEKQPRLNLNREPRFYGALAFNRAKWYGSGHSGNDSRTLLMYFNEIGNRAGYVAWMSSTGYRPRKLVNINTQMSGEGSAAVNITTKPYPFPLLRLADLYLLHSECSNETEGPTDASKEYIDKVRKRACLDPVDVAWAKSTNPSKPTTKDGLRQIIHQERLIEFSFEGQRFWDIRRWLKLETLGNQPLSGMYVNGKTAEDYYVETTRFIPSFGKKDYLWPIAQGDLLNNPNLVQSKGW